MEKILIPLDGSQVGEAALPVISDLIKKLAPKHKVTVTLVQVIPSSHWIVAGEGSAPVPYSEAEAEQIKAKATAYLESAAKKLAGTGASVSTRVVIGDAATEIHRVATEAGADLIAMSTHGRSGISRWAFGSVTDRVLRAGDTPVLTVRTPKESG